MSNKMIELPIWFLKKVKGKIWYWANKIKRRERRYSWGGEFPDKTFYVIKVDFAMAGLMAIVKTIVNHMEYATPQGYIPVVDMKNSVNMYHKSYPRENTWNLFFKQPYGYELEDIAHAKNVVVSCNWQCPKDYRYLGLDVLYDSARLEKLSALYNEHIKLNAKGRVYVDELIQKTLGNRKNVLGILCRGTDYLYKRPPYHPVQPTPEMVVEKVREIKLAHPIDAVFIATEDQSVLDYIKSAFNDECPVLYIDQPRITDREMQSVRYICELDFKQDDLMRMNLGYYASLEVLSKCDYLVAGRTSGTLSSLLMNPYHKLTYFFELGNYPAN